MWCLFSSAAARCAAALLAAALTWHLAAPVASWRLRHIPGPRAWPLLGNLPHLMRHGRIASLDAWAAQYGPLYKARAAACA
jgi:hypothetical protein